MVTLCKWPSGAPDGHLQRVTITDAVLIQYDLLMMSTTLLETCGGLYHVSKNKLIKIQCFYKYNKITRLGFPYFSTFLQNELGI